MSGPRRKSTGKRLDTGALCYVFVRADGSCGIVSMDRKVEGWGDSLDKAWRIFFVRARRAMRNYEASRPVAIPGNVGTLDEAQPEGELVEHIPVIDTPEDVHGEAMDVPTTPTYNH
jgi:hypothetical protein